MPNLKVNQAISKFDTFEIFWVKIHLKVGSGDISRYLRTSSNSIKNFAKYKWCLSVIYGLPINVIALLFTILNKMM